MSHSMNQNDNASAIASSASGGVSATNIEAAIDELDAEKVALEQVEVGNLLASGEEVFPRSLVNQTSVASHASGQVSLVYFTARKTETITQLKMITGGTAAAATPTLCKMGVYSVAANGDLTLAASTASDTSLFAATNTVYTKALSGGNLSKVKGQRYAFAYIVVTAGAMPTWHGNSSLGNAPAAEMGAAPRLTGVRTGQTDLPASIASGDIVENTRRPWGVLVP